MKIYYHMKQYPNENACPAHKTKRREFISLHLMTYPQNHITQPPDFPPIHTGKTLLVEPANFPSYHMSKTKTCGL